MMQAQPPIWNEEQLKAEAAEARAAFRRERLDEPADKWKQAHQDATARVSAMTELLAKSDIQDLTPAEVAWLFGTAGGDVLRYTAGPPISADDLEVLAEVDSLAPGRLQKNPDMVRRVLAVLRQALDQARFPWLDPGRSPSSEERRAAVVSTAALLAAQKVATYRRMTGKARQEATVAAHLQSIGFKKVNARLIANLSHAPSPGAFCGESLVGSRKADIVARLFDGRLMPIECKVSNSELNSVKRINNDAAVKAVTWRTEFGKNQIVPCTVLSRVFKVLNLVQTQEQGLSLFWAHRLGDLGAFIESTR